MNLVFAWCVERIKSEDRAQWEMMLSEPLPWQKQTAVAPTPFQAEDEGSDFMATMAMHQGRR